MRVPVNPEGVGQRCGDPAAALRRCAIAALPHRPGPPRRRPDPLAAVARPEGFERTPPTFVIEGVEELVKALLAA